MNWQVALLFYPNQQNPRRASGRGVWRVYQCARVFRWEGVLPRAIQVTPPGSIPMLLLVVTREFKRGSRIDPVSAALAFTRSQTATS